MNNNFAESIGYVVVGVLLVCFASVIGGTFLWLIWEDSLTAMFPKAIESGVLAAKLTWWQCVKISWVFSILFNTTKIDNKKDK